MWNYLLNSGGAPWNVLNPTLCQPYQSQQAIGQLPTVIGLTRASCSRARCWSDSREATDPRRAGHGGGGAGCGRGASKGGPCSWGSTRAGVARPGRRADSHASWSAVKGDAMTTQSLRCFAMLALLSLSCTRGLEYVWTSTCMLCSTHAPTCTLSPPFPAGPRMRPPGAS